MNRILYSGKSMKVDELKRVNCILQTQANNLWSEVTAYDSLYRSSFSNYLKGYNTYIESDSDFSNTVDEINDMSIVVNYAAGVEGRQEAAEKAQNAANGVNYSNETDTETPPETSSTDSDQAFRDALEKYGYDESKIDEAEQRARDALEALNAAREKDEDNLDKTENAAIAIENAGTKTETETISYVNHETGETQTVTVQPDGTISVSGVTAGDGTVGTVTQNPDGTMTFTTEDGRTMPWTGDDPAGIVNNAENYNSHNPSQERKDALEEAQAAQEHLKEVYDESKEAYEKATQEVNGEMGDSTPSGSSSTSSESSTSSGSSSTSSESSTSSGSSTSGSGGSSSTSGGGS